ncbi:MAG: hypothetical protein HYR89_01825 [Actinobacteria bacterium]|nr:hypothetical protein [Actinomycetota bacterium]
MSDVNGGMDQPPMGDGEAPSPWANPSGAPEAPGTESGPPASDVPASSGATPTWVSATTSAGGDPPVGTDGSGKGKGGKGKGGKVALIVVALLVVIGGGVAAALLLGGEDEPTAAELFAASKKFVAQATTATVSGSGTVETGDLGQAPGRGDKVGESGTTVVQRLKLKGQVAWPDRSLMRLDLGSGGVTEALVVAGEVYTRQAEKAAGLDDVLWAKHELPPGVVNPDHGGPILDPNDPSSGGPLALAELLAVAKAPKTFTRDGSAYVLALDLDPKDVLPDPEQTGVAFDRMTLTLRTEKDGRILGYTLVQRGDSVHSDITVNFVWGAKVSIEAPASDELDATPQVNEEAIGAFDASPVLVPAAIPSGWLLTLADVAPADQTAEGCEEVTIDYESPGDSESGYLYLYVFNTDCEGLDLVPPPGAEDFRPGKAGEGYVVGSPDDGWLAQFVVGGTVIQADTDLNPEELAQVMERLVVFDPGQQPGEIAGIGIATQVG